VCDGVRHDSKVTKNRLEAFSDGVLAIVITIMVLEFSPPEGADLTDLIPLWPKIVSYILSFAYLGIYWNNHHHVLQAASTVDGRVLWANLHLLFWLSLVPFGTAWMGEHFLSPIPVALYGFLVLMPALAFFVLIRALIAAPGQHDVLGMAIGEDIKGKISPIAYALAIPIALYVPLVAVVMYVVVAAMWIVPDPRIERKMVETVEEATD
jgi:uncharacterized membrane protein